MRNYTYMISLGDKQYEKHLLVRGSRSRPPTPLSLDDGGTFQTRDADISITVPFFHATRNACSSWTGTSASTARLSG